MIVPDLTHPALPATAPGLDVATLRPWLAERLPGLGTELHARRIEGGQSNPTWVLRDGHGAWVLRAKPAPAAKLLPSAHAIEREYRVQAALGASGVPVPRMRALCEDESVLGVAFYVMDFVEGRVLRDITLSDQSASERKACFASMNQTLVALHQVDWRAAGLADFGRAQGYFSRLIRRWSQQYQASAAQPCEAMTALARWLPEHIPEGADSEADTCLTHGDFRLENLMFEPDRPVVSAVLDWELSTLGHPLGDLAYNALSWHLPTGILRGLDGLDLSALQLPRLADHVADYCQATGRDLGRVVADWPFYVAFNLFRLAAILEGIAARQRQGQAAHPTAREIGAMAAPVAERGWAIASGERPAL